MKESGDNVAKNVTTKKSNVAKKSRAPDSKTNQKGSGSLAEIIPDWPKLKSFDRTKIKKKEVYKVYFWQNKVDSKKNAC